jgi:D-alanyl-D-alanine carboxypeptidase
MAYRFPLPFRLAYRLGAAAVTGTRFAWRHPRFTIAGVAIAAAGIGLYPMSKPYHKKIKNYFSSFTTTAPVAKKPGATPNYTAQPGKAELVMLFNAANPGGKIVTDTRNNSSEARPIASITKLATFLLLAEQIHASKLKWGQKVAFPGGAAGAPKTAMKIAAKSTVTIEELAGLMMIHSDNGAARALGLIIGGTKKKFLDQMHAKMKAIGFKSFTFVSPDGYYVVADGEKIQNTGSPQDVARLMHHVQTKFGKELDHVYEMDHVFRKQPYHAHTRLGRCGENENLQFKTGFTNAAGASVIAALSDQKDPNWKLYAFVGGSVGGRNFRPGAPRDERALQLIARGVKGDGKKLKDMLKYDISNRYCRNFTKQFDKLAQN